MKKVLKITAWMLTVFLCINATAQKQFAEGILQYNISIVSSKSEASALNSLNGAVLSVYLKPSASRTEMKSSLGVESTVFDNKSGNGFILKEYSGQKLMITMTKDNWNQKNQLFRNLRFTIDNTTQKIAGFSCKKATAKLENGKDFVVYFTPDVVPSTKEYSNAFQNLPGVPVQYELESGNLKFTYTLTEINYDNIPSVKFSIPKTGFRVMTYDENQQLKKG